MIQLNTVHFYSYLRDIPLHVEEEMIILFHGSQRTMMCIKERFCISIVALQHRLSDEMDVDPGYHWTALHS